MKKRYLLLAALLLIPFNAKAAEMKIECDKTTASPKSTVNCTIKAFDTEVSGGQGIISITNGVIKKGTKVNCAIGDVDANEFACSDLAVNTSLPIVTYEIEVGDTGTTTFGITEAKVVGTEFATIDSNVTPVAITISSTTPTDPEPTDPDPKPVEPTDPEPKDPEPKTPTEDQKQNDKKEEIENPETGTFLNTALILIALGGATYVVYNVAKKKKFFRI